MPTLNITRPALSAQKLTPVIQQSNNLPLADGIYQFGPEYVIILGGDEVAWSEDHTQAARSLVEMSEAELVGVLE
jgi:hypothetical protein